MGWEASIRMVDDDGQPRRGAKVTVSFSGPGILGAMIGTIASEYTDSDGWAHFEYENIDGGEMAGDTIWVDGEEVESGAGLENGETRTYSV